MVKKLALFDFCDTLVGFQTADAFVDYIRKINGNSYMRILEITLKLLSKFRIIALINKFFPGAGISKKVKLLQLRGFSYERLNKLAESFYAERIRPELIIPVMTEMQKLVQQGFDICIVSAGYSLYLKYFTKEYQIKHLISTDIAFDHQRSICRGRILGKDCIHVEKVNRVKTYFEGQNVNYKECISYSDSISDLPMLLLTGQGVVISRARSQAWSNQYKFNEIIWG